VEIYDPRTNSWALAASMKVGREAHTATLLPNGQVLVIGGFSASAEIYDPGTNSWAPAASMTESREAHTATLLLNGQILIAGGCTNTGVPVSGGLIYDPAVNILWGDSLMHTARCAHTATLLSNGQVLVAGGASNSDRLLTSLEIFTPPGPPNVPEITVTPTSLDFGSVQLYQAGEKVVTVKNDGVLNLTIGRIAFDGANTNQFSKTANKCSKKTLAPGASCTITVRFKPTVTGTKAATFIIPSNDPDENPFIVRLNGIGSNTNLLGHLQFCADCSNPQPMGTGK
jgi:hypothetical protein